MLITDLLSWWYFRGWGVFLSGFRKRLGDTADLFSIPDMLRTLFKPYRQISAGVRSDGALDTQIAAFFDRLVSRVVGFFARTSIIIAGLIVLTAETVLSVILAVIWPVVPVLPVVGIIFAVAGVTF